MIDLTKPVRTRDGRAVRILCTDREGGQFPVIALVKDPKGESFVSYTMTGHQFANERPSDADLENIPDEKKEFYILWDNGTSYSTGTEWENLEMAQNYGRDSQSYAGVLEITKINGKITEVNHHAR